MITMSTTIPTHARAVIIGGGVSGASVAYHLGKLGWRDVVLLERQQISCGTTWHAAGLLTQLRASRNMTRLAKYSLDLYRKLQEETGVETGLRCNGSMVVALNPERREELLRSATMARAFDVEVNEISLQQVAELYPYLETKGVCGALHIPGDGQCDPANIAMALVKGARQAGVQVLEGVKVEEVLTNAGRVSGLSWSQGEQRGEISSDIVVNCAGMWARDLAAANGVAVPLQACEHFYIITEPIADLPILPSLRIPDECSYFKEDAGKLLVGAFEPEAKPWGLKGIPESFCFDQLPEDYEHFAPILEQAIERIPILQEVGIHSFFNGPESFTPDVRYYLGESPQLSGYWVAAGYNSIGIGSSGGAGFALAQWLHDGEPPFDLSEVDIRRVQPFQKNKLYLQTRVRESLGLLYADHFPYRQFASARGVRRSPLHRHLQDLGAVFGELAGWERANWFAPAGVAAEYQYSWRRQNWFEHTGAEHRALRTGVGLYDMSSFGKIQVEGRDSLSFLQRLAANNVDVAVGKIVYTQLLNQRGAIESDLTIARLGHERFLVVTAAAHCQRDLAWLHKHRSSSESLSIVDLTAAEAVICVMGPQARQLLQSISSSDLSGAALPFGWAREIELGMGLARAHRISYVGELGYELYISADQAAHVFEAIWAAGQDFGLRLCGLHAMDSCRIEKGFRHLGHDITDEDHVLEAGLGFAVRPDKGEFIGRAAVLERQQQGLQSRMLQFQLHNPEPMLYHNEAIVRDGAIVSWLSSGGYGHHLGAAIGLGYVPCAGESAEQLLASNYEIEIAGERHPAQPSLQPLYDPQASRMRA